MEIDVPGLIMRWLHMLAAITAVGGTIFMRFALVPSVAVLLDDQRQLLHEEVRRRWARLVSTSISMLIVSGLTNFFFYYSAMKGAGIKIPPVYHAVFGTKVLLALAIFFLASALSGRSEALQRFRQNAKFWMTVNLVLAILVVCLSGVLRMTHIGPNFDHRESREPARV